MNILILPPIREYVNIHGFGKDSEVKFPRVLHRVINHICTLDYEGYKIIPSESGCVKLSCVVNNIEIINLYDESATNKCIIDKFLIGNKYKAVFY